MYHVLLFVNAFVVPNKLNFILSDALLLFPVLITNMYYAYNTIFNKINY